jgi:signal transduction histidine kinase
MRVYRAHRNAVTYGTAIDDLLRFSIRQGEFNRSLVNLTPLVEQVRETLAPFVVVTCDGTWPLPEVEGDPAMLRQVFSLLDNALKFTRPRECGDRNRRTGTGRAYFLRTR